MNNKPFLGFGLGLRPCHYQTIIDSTPKVDWFEILTEDYFIDGGPELDYLDEINEKYPIAMHGVSMSIGSTDPINTGYLHRLKKLIERVNPIFVSDHLCWTGIDGYNTHELLPIPYTTEALNHTADRIKQIQDYLGRQILIENASTYMEFNESEMPEWEFLAELSENSNCGILFDVNNAFVNGFNHKFDPLQYIKTLPKERVMQIHIAGHQNKGDYILDTHNAPIIDEVWNLFEKSWKTFGPVSTMIERDDDIPELNILVDELEIARKIATRAGAV